MAAQLYDVLRESMCPLCRNEFEDGEVVSFHGPCWIHPMCGGCRAEWRKTQLDVLKVYPTCPPCQREYNIFDEINIKLEPWHERGVVDYPPQPEGHVGVRNLAGHQAPCCDKGYTIGDYVIASSCSGGGLGGHQVHFMHAWCFLANRMSVDGNSLHYEDPFHCFTCGALYAPTNALTCHLLKLDGEEAKSEHEDSKKDEDQAEPHEREVDNEDVEEDEESESEHEDEENESGTDNDDDEEEFYEDEANAEEDDDQENEAYYSTSSDQEINHEEEEEEGSNDNDDSDGSNQ